MRTIQITEELENKQFGSDFFNKSKVAYYVNKLHKDAMTFTYTVNCGWYVTGLVTTKAGKTHKTTIFA